MATPPKSRPSFSSASRWGIGLDLVVRTLLMLAVVVMVNYLGAKFFQRYYLSSQTRVQLSPRTLSVVQALTNDLKVTLYYDRKGEFYPTIVALLNEYQAANSKISIQTVDYLSDPGAAEKTKVQYHLHGTEDKDLVIFDCNGRIKFFPGSALTEYSRAKMLPAKTPGQKEPEFERHPEKFHGEQAFTSMLLAVENPQPMKAYYLQGHGEAALADPSEVGYQKFAAVLHQNYIAVTNLDWLGNTGVPLDCNLLVIAGPSKAFTEPERQRIDQYLREGGRLLVLFNYASQAQPTGLEPILEAWGVKVLSEIAQDNDHTISTRDIVVSEFGLHPVVNALAQVRLQVYLPRPILKLTRPNPPANAPEVDELFATSASGTLLGDTAQPPHQYPLACAIEQKPGTGAALPRGHTRIIVVGDSVFLGNRAIEAGGNRDFLNSALNWLLDRPQLLTGIGPRPINEFRLQITQKQQSQLGWLLLGALPGGVLFFGWLVWLIRRQ